MEVTRITSARHPWVRHCAKLRASAKHRRSANQILLEGGAIVRDAVRCNPPVALIANSALTLEELITAAGHWPQTPALYLVQGAAEAKLSGLISPEGSAAVFDLPPPGAPRPGQFWLVCDAIADPGNLGTLIRTAKALEWHGVLITDNSCDPFNDKSLRAAAGAALRIPLHVARAEEISELKPPDTPLLWASAAGSCLTLLGQNHQRRGVWLAVGNESRGVCPKLRALGESVAVTAPGMESLNVACAGAILMFALKR